METAPNENIQLTSTIISNPAEQNNENSVGNVSLQGPVESKPEISGKEIRSILEAIAASGKFWLDWNKLKEILSHHLKQVLSEYPEAKMDVELQTSSLGETFSELVKRLDDAIQSFVEGPPFTLQRLCEILLDAIVIYPSLSKLSLALEKNLLVTSTLTMSADHHPTAAIQESEKSECGIGSQPGVNLAENGAEVIVRDGDEIMAEVDEPDVDDDMTVDMETFEEIVRSSETTSVPSSSDS